MRLVEAAGIGGKRRHNSLVREICPQHRHRALCLSAIAGKLPLDCAVVGRACGSEVDCLEPNQLASEEGQQMVGIDDRHGTHDVQDAGKNDGAWARNSSGEDAVHPGGRCVGDDDGRRDRVRRVWETAANDKTTSLLAGLDEPAGGRRHKERDCCFGEGHVLVGAALDDHGSVLLVWASLERQSARSRVNTVELGSNDVAEEDSARRVEGTGGEKLSVGDAYGEVGDPNAAVLVGRHVGGESGRGWERGC